MASYRVAIDKIRSSSQDLADLNTFCERLRKAGNTVTAVGRGPNKIQGHMMSKSNSCDVMIQIAGGLCTGTLGDFIAGIKRQYYHAKKGAIVYDMVANNLNPETWKAVKSHDWGGLSMSVVTPYVGKTLPQIYKENSDVLTKFAWGKTIDKVADMYLDGSTGATSEEGGGGGGSILDMIKQVCSDVDPHGPELHLHGDTLTVRKTQPKTAVALDESMIINNTVSFTDYDSNTPNTFQTAKDEYLINRFGSVPLNLEDLQPTVASSTTSTDEEGESTTTTTTTTPLIQTEKLDAAEQKQVLQLAERGHGHSIDMKVLSNPNFVTGKWVNLTLNSLGIINRPYYISKATGDDDIQTSITLEPGPPSLYVEPQPVTEEEETTEEETTEEDSSDSSGSHD